MAMKNFSKVFLLGLVGFYAFSNFTLFIASVIAWKKAKAQAKLSYCGIGGLQCGVTLWGIYPFQASAALVAFVTGLVMTINGLCRTKGSSVDPLYVFRGIFFSLLALAPIVFIGWSNLNYLAAGVVDDQVEYKHWGSPNSNWEEFTGGVPPQDRILNTPTVLPQFTGIGGSFVLQSLAEVRGVGLAIVLLHFNM